MINKLFKKETVAEKDILREFIAEDNSSLLLMCEGNLDEVLTILNNIRPIGFNKEFYVTHIVSQIHSQLNESNILSIVANSTYPNTKHVFIKGIDLPNDTNPQYNINFIQSISDMLKIDVSVKTKLGTYLETKYKGDMISEDR